MSIPVRGQVERFFLFAGVTLAVVLGITSHQGTPAVAQNAGAAGSPVRIATADVLSVTDRLMTQDRYVSAQKTQVEVLQKSLQPMQAELEGMISRFRGMEATNPERELLAQTITTKQQALQQESQRAMDQLESFKTAQAAEAYRLVVEEADRLAGELGYTHLIASRSGAVAIRSNNVGGAIQEMLARPVVRGVAADDLTERLLGRMKLTEIPTAKPEGDASGGAAPTGAK